VLKHYLKIIMKKFLITLSAAALLIGSGSSAQAAEGQLNFDTDTFPGAALLVFNTDGLTPIAGPDFVGRIYIGSTADFNTMSAIGLGASPFLTGQFAGFIEAAQPNAGLITSTGFNSGDSIFYSLAAWDSTSGDGSFGTSELRGNSIPVAISVGGTLASGEAGPPAPQLNTFASFNLEVVPEPSTVALGVIGGLALLMRRRK
jgi:hypothetical protein